MKALLLAAILLAHDWYPIECCNNGECRPVPCDEITNGDTYRGTKFPMTKHVPVTGQLFWREVPAIRSSPDGKCHACFAERESGGMHWIVPFCLFVPREVS